MPAIRSLHITPYFSLPFIYKDWGVPTAIVEQIAKNREKGCPLKRGRNYFLFGRFDHSSGAHSGMAFEFQVGVPEWKDRADFFPVEWYPSRANLLTETPTHSLLTVLLFSSL